MGGQRTEAVQTTFATGLFSEQDWEGAQWLTSAEDGGSRSVDLGVAFACYRGSYERAWVHVVAPGGFVLELDGEVVGVSVGLSQWNNLEKVAMVQTVDLTPYLRAAPSRLTLSLGHGFGGRNTGSASPVLTTPVARAKITCLDRSGEYVSYVSSAQWQARLGNVIADDPFAGTETDLVSGAPAWGRARIFDWASHALSKPPAELRPLNVVPVVQSDETVTPTEVVQLPSGAWLFSFPENFVGVTAWNFSYLAIDQDDVVMNVSHGEN